MSPDGPTPLAAGDDDALRITGTASLVLAALTFMDGLIFYLRGCARSVRHDRNALADVPRSRRPQFFGRSLHTATWPMLTGSVSLTSTVNWKFLSEDVTSACRNVLMRTS